MAMGGPIANTAENNANALNSNSQTGISPINPIYHATLAGKNMYKELMRLGLNIYKHIMQAAFDPVYGREFSLAHQYDRPDTRFPLAETARPNERSENANLVSILEGSRINPKKAIPFQNTATYDAGIKDRKVKEGLFQAYGGNYGGNYGIQDKDGTHTSKNPSKAKIDLFYKAASVARTVEERGKKYFKNSYWFHNKRNGTQEQNRNQYKNRIGSGEKADYPGQKSKRYNGVATGYEPQSDTHWQTTAYEGQSGQVRAYNLPDAYAGIHAQSSIDANIEGHETIMPRDVLEATIADAEEFLRLRKKNTEISEESKLESILSGFQ